MSRLHVVGIDPAGNVAHSAPLRFLSHSRSACIARLICVATAHDLDDRAEHDRQIKLEVPVLDVPKVELYASMHGVYSRRLSARSIHLCATGNARFHALPERIIGDDLIKVIVMSRRVWPRTDDGHLAVEHVDQLR